MLSQKIKIVFIAVIIIYGIITPQIICAQNTIEECYSLSEKNYPLIKKYSLIEKSREYSIANINKGYLPQLSINAKATYQSEVMGFSSELPINIPTIPKDQYNASITLNQTIWDGGIISASKKRIEVNAQVEKNSLESDIYTIRERVNNLFFGILLAQEQINQTNLFVKELEINYKNIESYISAGLANNADLDIVKVEQLKNMQRQKELQSTKESYLQMLSYITGKQIKEITPPTITPDISPIQNKRPELALFESQLAMQQIKRFEINSSIMPKFQLFIEGGYGNPALNILNPGFRGYGIGGVKLAWNFGSFYTRKNELNLINTNKQEIETQKDVFIFNTNINVIKENGEIEKIKKILTDDEKIIELKKNIVKSSQAKAANGTMTINELLKEINSSEEATQNKILHNIQLMLAIYNLKYTLNQ